MSLKYSLFSAYGIEAEYMIVNNNTMKVEPIADKIIAKLNNGKVCNEVEVGRASWSNELVNHVLEIKCTEPEKSIDELDSIFHNEILNVQKILKEFDCSLMPTAMHPWFDPSTETMLWPHGQREIYSLYNEIFDCKGHGWANLQSVHINLPYQNEEEFVLLHSSIRIILPLIPYFCASSPFFGGAKQKYADNRLSFYEKNQAKVPSIIGNIIPEKVNSINEYKQILKGIYKDISHYENAKTLQQPWLNSRAAIPKFDVGAIEIRLMDIQECPLMDFALIHLIVNMVKFVSKNIQDADYLGEFTDSYLRSVYDQGKEFFPEAEFSPYYNLFNISGTKNLKNFQKLLIEKFECDIPVRYHKGLSVLKNSGSLALRITQSNLSHELYRNLIDCLNKNIPYEN